MVIRLIDKTIEKPVQWFICLLHINELPLRHLFDYLEGPTTEPRIFSRTIDKALQTCDKRPVISFEQFPARQKLRNLDVNALSQWFSTGVPLHFRVPIVIRWGAVSHRTLFIFLRKKLNAVMLF